MGVILGRLRVVLFEFHLKLWNTASLGIPVRSLLLGIQGIIAQWFANKRKSHRVRNILSPCFNPEITQ